MIEATHAGEYGMQKIADAFGIKITFFCADGDSVIQAKQVDQTIINKPDLVIIAPISSEFSTEWYKKINNKDIPIVVSKMTPNDEGFKYILFYYEEIRQKIELETESYFL